MTYQHQIQDVEELLIASMRDRFEPGNLAPTAMALSGQVWDFLRSHPEIPQPGTNVWVYLGDGIVEAGAQVLAPFKSDGPVLCSSTPAGRAVVTTHWGPYDKIPEAYDSFRAWAADQNLQLAGPSWEVYGHWNEDPAKLRTDIFHLLA